MHDPRLVAARRCSGCLVAAAPAQAQSYPTTPITIVVPAAAGGVSDMMARADRRSASPTAWGQQVIVENRGGANHVIGAAMVGKAAPDGHTLMVGGGDRYSSSIRRCYAGKLPYDVKRLRAGHRPRPHQPGAAGASIAAGQQHRRTDRARQAEARRDHLRQLRPRRRRRTSISRSWKAWPASSSRRCIIAARRRR